MASIARLNRQKSKRVARVRAHLRTANRAGKPRIAFHVSGRHLYAQVFDDATGKTLVTCSTLEKSLQEAGVKSFTNKSFSAKLAEALVGKMQSKNLKLDTGYIFDRGAKLYHGRVQSFAEKLREKGVKI
ncbi:MAG TPA: 50S ribosomal protein L18 [Turneriella sp.]|nr:50S ribosomal protein L18 [Turneriella sp.]